MSLVTSTRNPADAVYRHVIPAGEPWLFEIKKGQTLRLLDHTLLPQAQATRDASRAALASGMVDFDSVIEAERQLIDIRTRRLQTELETRLALAEIKKLTGEFK